MSHTYIPEKYKSLLSVKDTEAAIVLIKRTFERRLAKALNLSRVSAPLFVESGTGYNDDLNGTERAVSFDIKETGTEAQIVHSLAKWKRHALKEYGFAPFSGLYTDMNAIRRDEEMDNIHSIYVDQWDWEQVVTREARNFAYLKKTVRGIARALTGTLAVCQKAYPALRAVEIEPKVTFVTSQQLEDKYPQLTPKEREDEFVKKYKTVFIMQIGGKLKSGVKHDGRAPDYDDWKLNGDLMVWNSVLNRAFELSSMGIRVDSESLLSQLKTAGCEDRLRFPFHRMLADGALPLTMGGGIGQSRTCMLIMGKAHIGEVQVSIWDKDTIAACEKAGIELL